MKIAFVSSEAVPYAKTGGLADVAGSLPKALEKIGVEVKIFIPKYSTIDEDKFELRYNWDIGEMPIRVAGFTRSVHLHQAKLPDSNVEVNFIDCPHYFHRGRIYTDDHDEDERFILFSKGVIETLQRMKWQPDVIHCNDWQTGLLPLFVKDNYSWDRFFDKTSFLFTIHNIGYQGRFPQAAMFKGEIGGNHFHNGGPVELNGTVSFLKSGIIFSEIINTVSHTYAKEILTPEYGAGMEAALAEREEDLYGVLNGIDYEIWDPEKDKHLPFHYSIADMRGKEKNKKFLLEHLNMPYDEKVPLIGMISRMAVQKGFDIFAEAADELMDLNAQWIILGSGENKYEEMFRFLESEYPRRFGAYIGFNNELAHLIEAGADLFLMPSRYEPCGLNQMYSLRYGTVPIVRKTGGLADTVWDWDELSHHGRDEGTGFNFHDYSAHALSAAVRRALKYYSDKNIWNKLRQNGMSKDLSWEHSAKEYLELYKKAAGKNHK